MWSFAEKANWSPQCRYKDNTACDCFKAEGNTAAMPYGPKRTAEAANYGCSRMQIGCAIAQFRMFSPAPHLQSAKFGAFHLDHLQTQGVRQPPRSYVSLSAPPRLHHPGNRPL